MRSFSLACVLLTAVFISSNAPAADCQFRTASPACSAVASTISKAREPNLAFTDLREERLSARTYEARSAAESHSSVEASGQTASSQPGEELNRVGKPVRIYWFFGGRP